MNFDPRKHYAELTSAGWVLSQCGDLLDEETFVSAWLAGDSVDMCRLRNDGVVAWYYNVRIGWSHAEPDE